MIVLCISSRGIYGTSRITFPVVSICNAELFVCVPMKIKISLFSEGQRKAAFEEFEVERKSNADLILKLKKEIKELIVTLQINRDAIAANKVKSLRLEAVVGPLKQRTCKQLIETLDLQTIDLKKQLDLIRHRRKQVE